MERFNETDGYATWIYGGKKLWVIESFPDRLRALDNVFVERLWRNVKYEDIYLKDYASMPALFQGLGAYFIFYNHERPHQALGYKTPNEVYLSGRGGGAKIVDKFKKAVEEPRIEEIDLAALQAGQRCSVAWLGIS